MKILESRGSPLLITSVISDSSTASLETIVKIMLDFETTSPKLGWGIAPSC